jgi:DNA-directed RNA polymerase
MSLENIEGYLIGKLTQRGKPSKGVSLLKEWGDIKPHLEELVYTAYDIITVLVVRTSAGDPAGTAKLTQVSSKIGNSVGQRLFDDILEWRDAVRLGDLFVEAFLQLGYITVHYPRTRDTSYVVKVTDKWREEFAEIPDTYQRYRLSGTLFEKPAPISGLMQRYDREDALPLRYPIVKNWDYTFSHHFNRIRKLPCIRAANKLQQTAWRINNKVYDAVMAYEIDEVPESDFEKERLESKKMKLAYVKAKATALKNKTFYCLIDFDYRGRIYYRETMFNFQSSDYERGLFLFDESKEVDATGFKWMCIHAANSFNASYKRSELPSWLTGDYHSYLEEQGLDDISVDKMTLRDRQLWTLNNLGLVESVSEFNALMDCEKPVAFLAVAHEIVNYMKAEKMGIAYHSSLPVPIDGSNNGWQHLGAISKDTQTGELVGLIPVDIQRDFYVRTAQKLIEITKDEHRSEILDAMPMKKIRKGISKRGSMTRAYSAGAMKIAENMVNDLRKEGYDVDYSISEKDCVGFSRDLIKAIELVCPGPLRTMKFLQHIAAAVLESGNTHISWYTPSGFFVHYEKFYEKIEKVKGTIVGVGKRDQVYHVGMSTSDKPDPRGFACGISPNYIHSLDASHMAKVIDRWGGDFGAVHDSFSTHPSDVEELCELTKDVFIEMYDSTNYFDKIEQSIVTKYDVAVEQPALGTLDIQGIKHSDYFFA